MATGSIQSCVLFIPRIVTCACSCACVPSSASASPRRRSEAENSDMSDCSGNRHSATRIPFGWSVIGARISPLAYNDSG